MNPFDTGPCCHWKHVAGLMRTCRLAKGHAGDHDDGVTKWANLEEPRGCPCLYVTPCFYACSCAHPTMSGGCRRCCAYGSPEQQRKAAEYIAAAVDAYDKREQP